MTRKQAVNYLYSSGFSDEQVKTVVEAIRKDPCLDSGWYEGMNKEESLEIIKAYRDKLKNSVSNQLEDDIAAFDMVIEAMSCTALPNNILSAIDFAVEATGRRDDYTLGMCNGMIYVKSLIDGKNPEFLSKEGEQDV